MIKFFDIHSHLNSSKYDTDREEVVQRLIDSETGTIVVGTDFESSKQAVELAERYKNIFACIGVHPVDDPKREFRVSDFELLASHPKVVAVGECGLDFFHAKKDDDFERQKKLFLEQIEFALRFDKPLMIHVREAYSEILDILEPLKREQGSKLRGNIHFFAGTLEEARRFWAIDFTTSFTGVVTFTNSYDEVILSAPLEMLHIETDAPYVAPTPHRGKRNEPAFVREVLRRVAEIRGEDEELVRRALLENACRAFGLVLE